MPTLRFILVTAIFAIMAFAKTSAAQDLSGQQTNRLLLPPLSECPRTNTHLKLKNANEKESKQRYFRKEQFFTLSAAVYGAALADMYHTHSALSKPGSEWYERDPLARPVVKLPAPAYYASGLALATGVNFISWRMGHSRKFHKFAIIPQLLAIAGNSYGVKSFY